MNFAILSCVENVSNKLRNNNNKIGNISTRGDQTVKQSSQSSQVNNQTDGDAEFYDDDDSDSQ